VFISSELYGGKNQMYLDEVVKDLESLYITKIRIAGNNDADVLIPVHS